MNPTPKPMAVALVTGGAKRVGKAICHEFAGRGMRVVVHANSSLDEADQLVEEIRTRGGEATSVGADLTDEQATRDAVDQAHDAFGRLDVLVNSAAIWSPKPLDEVTADDLRGCFEVNTIATFVCAQQAGRHMVGQDGGGAIVNLGDWADGPDGRPYPGYAAYHPSKGAIPALTRCLAIELAAKNPKVRVNAVLPGPVLASPGENRENRPTVFSGNLLEGPGTAKDVADAVALLALNPFLTGVCLPVDGGRRLAAPAD